MRCSSASRRASSTSSAPRPPSRAARRCASRWATSRGRRFTSSSRGPEPEAPMKEVVVIGGGFAGLAAATRLVEAGARVTLLEKRAQLGGRAYSVVDEASGDVVDNGQHLFMGCYRATRAFLARIGSADKLRLQERLDIAFVDAASGRASP